MTLSSIREAMHQDMPSMAALLGINYETYRSYEYGRRTTPPEVMEKAEAALQADRQWIISFKKQLGQELDRKYPMGIDSQ